MRWAGGVGGGQLTWQDSCSPPRISMKGLLWTRFCWNALWMPRLGKARLLPGAAGSGGGLGEGGRGRAWTWNILLLPSATKQGRPTEGLMGLEPDVDSAYHLLYWLGDLVQITPPLWGWVASLPHPPAVLLETPMSHTPFWVLGAQQRVREAVPSWRFILIVPFPILDIGTGTCLMALFGRVMRYRLTQLPVPFPRASWVGSSRLVPCVS